MKRVALTVSISLTAFIVAAVIAHSRGQHQYEKHLGAQGWTLKRTVNFTPVGGEPRIVGREEVYFAADGRHRKDIFSMDDEGKEFCPLSTIFIPGIGVFNENSKNQTLMYVADNGAFVVDVNIKQLRSDPNYIGDQEILGYKCAIFRTTLNDGSVMESYDAYQLGRYTLKSISRDNEGVQIWEPTSIEIGPVSESEFMYNNKWPVDFSEFEKRIQRVQSISVSDQNAAKELNSMRQQLEQAKQRFSAQGYTIK